MKLMLITLIALSLGLYELPRVEYTSGVAGAKQAAYDVEMYLDRAREAVEDVHIWGKISAEVWDEYKSLDECTVHFQHLFVMSVLFYDETPIENPYGQFVTQSSYEMVTKLLELQRLLFREGIEVPRPAEGLLASAHQP
jgi:hypothetical protein